MDSLVGYGSDDDNETERYSSHHSSVGHNQSAGGGARRRDDDTNYDDVNMDMSEDSQAESEPELPPAEAAPPRPSGRDDRYSESRRDSRDRDTSRRRDDRRRNDRDKHRPDRDTRPDDKHSRADRDSRSEDKYSRSEEKHGNRDVRPDDKYKSERESRPEYRGERDRRHDGRRGLLGDRPDDRPSDGTKVPSLMELKPYGGEAPPSYSGRSQDARDAVSPRFMDRERRDREKDRERDRHSRRSEEKRDRVRHGERTRSRSRDRGDHGKPRGCYIPPPETHAASSSERRGSPPTTSTASSDYRPSSYKVNKKLEVMEKMGLQIKTPDGSMATAQQLRQAASEAPAAQPSGLPSYFNASAVSSSKILDQVQKRKLLWSSKKSEAEEAAKWSGTRFAQDSDGKQVSKFMRLMGIKEPNAVKQEPPASADPIKKQEELFQAMQAQYEVARATTHTMRGVGLGFQRGQF